MALKRKRSSELFNSPARSDSSMESFDLPISPGLAFPRAFATPSHLHSRTMKRFRNNRPSEEEVHQRTLNLLYSAQQQNQNSTTQPSEDSSPSPALAARNTQKSLHSFWTINSAAPSVATASTPSIDRAALDPVSCEDCGAGLGSAGDATMGGMEIDSYGVGLDAEQHSCGACGKHVCSHCSITNLGEQRRCLQCASRKTWATGGRPSWTTSSISFF